MIVCYSRCLICGRRTPHEACHRHSLAMGGSKNWPSTGPTGKDFQRNHARMYRRHFDDEPEVCNDPACLAGDDPQPAAIDPDDDDHRYISREAVLSLLDSARQPSPSGEVLREADETINRLSHEAKDRWIRDLIDSIEIADANVPQSFEDNTVTVKRSDWNRIVAVAHGSTSAEARRKIDRFRLAATSSEVATSREDDPYPFDWADNMCPNCLTPWKCNGPHLIEETVAAKRERRGHK